jgi:glycosyltransferase involved in cell wall biosynthesis
VKNGQNGLLVPPGDCGQLVESLERLLTNEPLRSELGHRGSKTVGSNYGCERFRSDLEAVLRDCGLG